jgi:hypothetical protein
VEFGPLGIFDSGRKIRKSVLEKMLKTPEILLLKSEN